MKKHLFVISPDSHMTGFCGVSQQKGGDSAKEPSKTPILEQIEELKRLLEALPEDRQQVFHDELGGSE